MQPITGQDFVAVEIRHTNGRANYVLTLGKFWWQAELADIAAAVLDRAGGFAMDGEPRSAEVCYSLAEASGTPFFFEHLLALSRLPLPDYGRLPPAEADRAAEAIHAEVRDGRHLYFCGSQRAFGRHRRARERAGDGAGDPADA